MKKLFILLILLVFIFGCINSPEPIKDSFKLGETFTIKENQTLTEEKEKFIVKVVSFVDSRCPAEVKCIWEGELGVDLLIVSSLGEQEIYLGATTVSKENFSLYNSYEIELLSIDFETKTAELKITEIDSNTKTWFSIKPIQCKGNNWNTWPASATMKFENELSLIKNWFDIEHNIKVYEIKSKQIYEAVCSACSCSRGDKIAVLVDVKNKEKTLDLGWEEMIIECAEETKQCPNGSITARINPFCDFEKCSQ